MARRRYDHTDNVTRRVRELTGITVEALARKLGVSADKVSLWETGAAAPPSEATAVLESIIRRTEAPLVQSGPREGRPELKSRVACADSVEYLKQIPDETVSLILSDIPYGIGLDDWDVLHSNSNSAYMGQSSAQVRAGAVFKRRRKPINGWSSADREIPRQYYDWCSTWASEWLRVLRPGGSAMVFAGRRLAHRCITALEDAGFNYRDLLAWVKPSAVLRAQRLSVVLEKRGDLAEAERWKGWRVGNLKPSFEPIIWCFKPYAITIADNVLDHHVGAFNLEGYQRLSGGEENILRHWFEPGEKGFHEAQKPVSLLRCLIELSTVSDQVVLDPFAGSGSTGVAAKASGRRYVLVEQDPELCRVAGERVAQRALDL